MLPVWLYDKSTLLPKQIVGEDGESVIGSGSITNASTCILGLSQPTAFTSHTQKVVVVEIIEEK